MNEQMRIPVQFLATGNSVRPEKQALFESLMSAVLLGMETAERAHTAQERPAARDTA